MSSESVNGGSTVSYDYDDDGLLIRAGELVISRYPNTSPWSGLISGTTLGNVTDAYEYNDYGEVAHYTARFGTTEIYDAQYRHDTAGRIDQVTETIDGVTRVFGYEYYPRGELKTVSRNGAVIASYSYDANGNRLTADGERGFFSGTANDRDQMTSYGGASFSYSPAGEMLTRTDASGTRSFDFDGPGALRGVALPDGSNVEYVLDAAGHRVGKRVDGALVERRLYGRQLEVLADLDATGAVRARYVFLDPLGSAAYATKDGHTYRIISDHLGSARIVIDATSGQVAQRLDFDEWGELRQVSAPYFQPFAFTGREWDPETALSYFRARYYDPKLGRFLSEDPVGFLAGPNFYSYVRNNPVNLVDPMGLQAMGLSIWDFFTWYTIWDHGFRRPGHRNFPGENNSFLRHCVMSCEGSRAMGPGETRLVGALNELQGFVQIDIPQLIRGGDVTAFALQDLVANEIGIQCSEDEDKNCERECVRLARKYGYIP